MTIMARCLFLSLFAFQLASSDWTQQYGDPASTNYKDIDTFDTNISVWNYTYPGQYSYIYNSPAVSDKGVVFLPFLKYKPYSENGDAVYDLEIRTFSPNGTMLWIASDLGTDKDCGTIFLTNAVYSSKRDQVFIGWTCAADFTTHKKHGQIVAVDAQTGEKVWHSPFLYDANDMSRIVISTDVLYASGGYDCWKDVSINEKNTKPQISTNRLKHAEKKSNISQIYAFNLDDGKMIWVKNYAQVGCTSQIKIAPMQDEYLVTIPVNLTRGLYLAGSLLALKCDKDGQCTEKWLNKLRLSWGATFAFSIKDSVLYGAYGFAGNPDLIFGLDIDTGKTVFSSRGYCDPGNYPSGPAVDEQGYAYYSCGNRVFAVDTTGKLIWKSKQYGKTGYTFYNHQKLSPIIDPHGYIIFMDTASKVLYALSSSDGSEKSSYTFPSLEKANECSEPPFIVGNRIYWIIAQYYVKYYLFSAPLTHLIN